MMSFWRPEYIALKNLPHSMQDSLQRMPLMSTQWLWNIFQAWRERNSVDFVQVVNVVVVDENIDEYMTKTVSLTWL